MAVRGLIDGATGIGVADAEVWAGQQVDKKTEIGNYYLEFTNDDLVEDNKTYETDFTNDDLADGKLTVVHNLGWFDWGNGNDYIYITDNESNQQYENNMVIVDGDTIEVDLTSYVPIAGTWHIAVHQDGIYLTVNHTLKDVNNVKIGNSESAQSFQMNKLHKITDSQIKLNLNNHAPITGTWWAYLNDVNAKNIFYVNKNGIYISSSAEDGSFENPYRTIQKAIDETKKINGIVSLMLFPGIYDESILVPKQYFLRLQSIADFSNSKYELVFSSVQIIGSIASEADYLSVELIGINLTLYDDVVCSGGINLMALNSNINSGFKSSSSSSLVRIANCSLLANNTNPEFLFDVFDGSMIFTNCLMSNSDKIAKFNGTDVSNAIIVDGSIVSGNPSDSEGLIQGNSLMTCHIVNSELITSTVESQYAVSVQMFGINRPYIRNSIVKGLLNFNGRALNEESAGYSENCNWFEGNLQLNDSTKAFYFGNSGTDGSWRIVRNGNNLEMQRRESGVWVVKQTIDA